MTDRLRGFTVLLDRDTRVDDFEVVKNAILMIKGVVQVDEVINDSSVYMTEMKVTSDIRDKLYKFINENL